MEEPAQPKPEEEKDPFWDRLGLEIADDWKKGLEEIMRSDVVEFYGITYTFNPIKNKDIVRFKQLDAESFKIIDKDTQEWYDNVQERACMVIKDMTPEQYLEGDSEVIENITTGWSNRALRGFRRLKQSV